MKLQPRNGFIIKSFYMDMRDKELVRVMPLLVMLSEVNDVRTVRDWSKKFQSNEMIEYTDLKGENRIVDRN